MLNFDTHILLFTLEASLAPRERPQIRRIAVCHAFPLRFFASLAPLREMRFALYCAPRGTSIVFTVWNMMYMSRLNDMFLM